MPCSRGMRLCRSDCLHRRDVGEYRAARQADEERMEYETRLFAGDVTIWKEANYMITFKDWLIGKRQIRREEPAA